MKLHTKGQTYFSNIFQRVVDGENTTSHDENLAASATPLETQPFSDQKKKRVH
jgi:hypothetical protein